MKNNFKSTLKISTNHWGVKTFIVGFFCLFLFNGNSFSQGAIIEFDPAAVTIDPSTNATFTSIVQVNGTGMVDAVEVHITFDPDVLQVNSATGLNASLFPFLGLPVIDNVNGTIDYATVSFGTDIDVGFDFLELEFDVIGTSSPSVVDFNGSDPTKAVLDGGDVLTSTNPLTVTINSADTPPIVDITTPIDGVSVTRGSLIPFMATATDAEDGDIGADIQWSSSDPSFAGGAGASITGQLTEPGAATVTATVTDSDGNVESDVINVTVSCPQVSFTSPIEGETITGTTVNVDLSATDVLFGTPTTPNEHFHFYINPVDPNNPDSDKRISTANDGNQTSFTFDENSGALAFDGAGNGIQIGANTIVVAIANSNHIEFSCTGFVEVNFTVAAPANTPPSISLAANASVNEEGNLDVPLSITDTDGDALTVIITSTSDEPELMQSVPGGGGGKQRDPYPQDAGGFLTETAISSSAGSYTSTLSFAPTYGDGGGANGDGSGSYTITVSVDDGNNPPVVQTLELTVDDVEHPVADDASTRIEAEDFDNQGPPNPNPNGTGNAAGIGVEVNAGANPFTNIGFTNVNDFAEYSIDVASAGVYELKLNVGVPNTAGNTTNKQMQISSNGNLLETFTAVGTGGFNNYVDQSVNINLPAGSQTLRFDWTNGNNFLFNIDYFELTPVDNQAPIFDLTISDQLNGEGDVVSLSASATDPEADNITYGAANLPQGLSINTNTGEITGTIVTGAASGSPYMSSVTATDDGTPIASTTQNFEWTVELDVNTPPTIVSVDDVEVDEGQTVTVNIQVIDDTDPSASIIIYDKSMGGSNNPFTPSTVIAPTAYSFVESSPGSGLYTLTWPTGTSDGRAYEARVTANDGVNTSVEERFNIDVAQDIPDIIKANTFADPVPWYGPNPQSPFTVSVETAGNIGYIDNGEFVEYLIDVPAAGAYDLRINASKGNNSSGLLTILEEDGAGFSQIGTVTIINDGWSNYSDYNLTVFFSNEGLQTLRFDFSGGMNIEEFEFTPIANTLPPIFTQEVSNQTNLEGDSPSGLQVAATDPDGGTVLFSDDGTLPPGLIINVNTGEISGTISSGAASNSPYTVTITATDDEEESNTSIFTWTVIEPVSSFPLCINSGNQGALTAFGQSFTADQYFTNFVDFFNKTNVNIIGTIPGSTEEDLFQSERYGAPLSYAIPTGNGAFTVELFLTELFVGVSPGSGDDLGAGDRVFDINIEGIPVETDIDLFLEYGPATAATKTFQVVVTDGILNIDLPAAVDNGKLGGICITETANFTPNAAPTITITEGSDLFVLDCEGDGEMITLNASASDAEQGDMDAIIIWKNVAGDILGTGPSLDLGTILGTNIYIAEVTDATPSIASASITVTVPINTAPSIDPITASSLSVTAGSAVTLSSVASDLEDESVSINWSSDLDGSLGTGTSIDPVLSEGEHLITASVTDQCGESSSETITIIITPLDETAPVITLLGDDPLELIIGTPYSEPGATALDDVDGDISENIDIDNSTVDVNTLGSYQVTYNVSDAAGNPAIEVIRTVNVVSPPDETAPVITLLGDDPLELIIGTPYSEPGATALDDVDGDISENIDIDNSTVDVNTLGSYQVTYNVSDAAGNPANEVIRTVNVVAEPDNIAPIITLIGDDPFEIIEGTPFVDPGALAFDDVDGNISEDIIVDDSALDINTTGSYPVTYNVSDATGNPATEVIRTVNVVAAPDETAPVISLLGDSPLEIMVGAVYEEPGATATDDVDGDLTESIVIDDSNVDVNTPGSYMVTYNVSDAAGNPAIEVIRIVTVLGPAVPCAYVSIDASSTFGGGIVIQNNSQGGLLINSVSFDVSTAIYPNIVFDPVGDAGDGTAKCLDVSSETGGDGSVGLTVPGNGGTGSDPDCVDPFSNPVVTNGYSVMTVEFTDFEEGEAIEMAVDVDPLSILGFNAAGNAGAISGLELTGTTVTVNFSDGSSATSQLYRKQPNSINGSENYFYPNAPACTAPQLTILNANAIDEGNFNDAYVNGINQTAQISGLEGEAVSLLVIESTIEDLGPGVTPGEFEANKAQVIQEFDAVIGASGAVDIPFSLNDEDSGIFYYIVATKIRTDDGICGIGTCDLSEVWRLIIDDVPPVITLLGDNPQVSTQGSPYVEQGAIALDDIDGDISANIIIDDSNVDINTPGSYLVTYDVMDAAGNAATQVTRVVNIIGLGDPCAYVAIDGTSTFGGGFIIENNSPVGILITSVSFDLSTAIYPNIVFDPVGDAGDNVAKCLEINSETGGDGSVGLTIPGDGGTGSDPDCVTPFSSPVVTNGFSVMTLNFTDFEEGEAINMAVDVDPLSILGFSGAGNAGAISGLELAGTTVTVNFSDGSSATGQLYRIQPNDANGAENYFYPTAPACTAPQLNILGAEAATNGNFNDAYVTTINQTAQISGTEGEAVSLLIIESTIEDLGPDVIPEEFEANKAQVIQELDAVIGANGTVTIPFSLNDEDSGIFYYIVATKARTDDGICGLGTCDLSEVWRLIVEDLPPVITLIGDNPLELIQGSPYNEPGATAIDELDGDISGDIVIDDTAVNINAVGSYPVTYNVSDAAGNAADEVIRIVEVIVAPDETAPVITLLGDNPLELIQGSSYNEPGATALDDVDGDISGNIIIDDAAVDVNSLGSYLVTYNVSDAAGNAADEVVRIVEVIEAPADLVDLSLQLNPSTSTLPAFSNFNMEYVVMNSGSVTATNVIVDIPIYKEEGLRQTTFSPANLPAGHSFLYISDELSRWIIPSLAPGTSTSVSWDFYSVQNEVSINYFTQIIDHTEDDLDSAPNNNLGPVPTEDDEALAVLLSEGGVPTCSITGISISNISACNDQETTSSADDTFTADITVNFLNAPATGTLSLIGDGSDVISVSGMDSPTTHTFTGVTMTADGGPIALSATFSADLACTLTNSNVTTAPTSCSGPEPDPCSITSISTSNISSCNDQGTSSPADDSFTADITVVFANPPSTGFLTLGGDATGLIPVGSLVSNSYTFVGLTLSADGGLINLVASFSAGSGCSLTNSNAGTAPAPCSVDPPAEEVDLSLQLLPSTSELPAFSTFSMEYIVANQGGETATNIVVDIPIYKAEGLRQTTFSPANLPAGHSFLYISDELSQWLIPSLAPGTSTSVSWDFYSVQNSTSINYYTQIVDHTENDADSSPDNNPGPTPTEDDEALAVLQSEGSTPVCAISSISLGNISACNDQGTPSSADDTFTADVTVVYSNAPSSGTLNLSGAASASIGAAGISEISHTFFGLTFSADGGPIAMTASFSADAACSLTNSNAGTAPAPCSIDPSCTIGAISVANISECNDQGTDSNADDTFTADVTVSFVNAPSTGFLDLIGDGFNTIAVGSMDSPTAHTFTDVSMFADGGPISLTASFSEDVACTFTNTNAGAAPPPCSAVSTSDTDLSLTVSSSTPTLPIFSSFTMTYTVTNSSAVAATNIEVDVPIYKAEGLRQTSFSPANLPAGHSFLYISDELSRWVIPSLGPNTSTTFSWEFYSTQNSTAIQYYTQIITASPDDIDSSPGNNAGPNPLEDDEALQVLSAAVSPLMIPEHSSATNTLAEFSIGQVYPNPVEEALTITIHNTKQTRFMVEILDILGRVVIQNVIDGEIGVQKFEQDVSQLASGAYLLRLRSSNSQQVEQFIKE